MSDNVENVDFGVKTGAVADFEQEMEKVIWQYAEHMTVAELLGTIECVKYKVINTIDDC